MEVNKDDNVLVTKAQIRAMLNKEKFMEENKEMWKELHRYLTALPPASYN